MARPWRPMTRADYIMCAPDGLRHSDVSCSTIIILNLSSTLQSAASGPNEIISQWPLFENTISLWGPFCFREGQTVSLKFVTVYLGG